VNESKEFVGEVEDDETKDEEQAEAEEKAEVEAETEEFGDDVKEQKPSDNDGDYRPLGFVESTPPFSGVSPFITRACS
jgi:hypothetical protein